MRALRSRLAVVLLLCFARVLLPDAWVLALHAHQHTTHEPTQAPGWPKGKSLLSAKHQHCDTDQFFKSAFEAPLPVVLPVAARGTAAPVLTVATVPGYAAPCFHPALRGPPSRS
ncbi:hypothetical protein [Hymenobacter weizhouensis]|uniref:hypothetical protein n=1 Tax=Hymenobacter sp. YIM 151500-1 TaxID=2987689 RepID=UPI00222608BF|nr:hypothetical protein [Hymenobacter sp. YIM 151500-1]UYZ61934.1 hypothetical protein OIS53_13090 [Hymenobacter sp. YIM 151500-1]